MKRAYQLDLPIAFARKSDPATSKTAAASVKNLGWSQRAVRECFEQDEQQSGGPSKDAGMTDSEMIGYYNKLLHSGYEWPWQSESGLRTRRAELVELGVLYDTGAVRKLDTGRDSIVWALKRENP